MYHHLILVCLRKVLLTITYLYNLGTLYYISLCYFMYPLHKMHEVFIEKKMLLFSMAMPGIAGIVWLDLPAPRSQLNTCTCCGYFEQPTANTKSVQKDYGRCCCGVNKISGKSCAPSALPLSYENQTTTSPHNPGCPGAGGCPDVIWLHKPAFSLSSISPLNI